MRTRITHEQGNGGRQFCAQSHCVTWPGWLYTAGEDPLLDRLRAAAQLVGNHGAVTRFAARGCGREGRRPVSAPLSDPSATPGEEHIDAVDAGGLRMAGSCGALADSGWSRAAQCKSA